MKGCELKKGYEFSKHSLPVQHADQVFLISQFHPNRTIILQVYVKH